MSGERDSVLVVDDEESVRNLLQRILKEAGYAVDSAANGQEALEIMAQMRPGVVLLDIKMPGMSGIEVLKQITATWPDTGVIMATAVTDTQTAIDTMKLGAYDYIGKPFNRDDLLVKVQRAFEKRVLLLENEHHRFDLERRLGDQTEQLQQQFVSLVEALAREHDLLYKLSERQHGGSKTLFSRLPKELQVPMSSVEEFSDALLKILRRGALKPK